MINLKRSRTVRCAAFFIFILLAVTILPISAAKESKSEITSILLNKKGTDIAINISLEKEYAKEHKNETLYVFELSPWQSTSELSMLEPVAQFKASESVKVSLTYINGNANRLYSKFLVAEKAADGSYSIVTSAKYIENIEQLAENTEDYPTSKSKKGLQAQILPDLQELGVKHASINIPINEYIIGENTESAASFVYSGQTYYINKAKLESLDHKVKCLTDSGMTVYFNFILTSPSDDISDTVKSFYCTSASDDAQTYAFNTRNETAMKNFQAFLDYMASRYTRADHAYGFVPNFTIGFQLNDGRYSNNAGSSSLTASVYSYHTAFRIAYSAMVSHYSNGRVFISLGNNWNSASTEPSGTTDSAFDWSAKEYLDLFASVVRNSGDINWGLSLTPYPSDKSLTEFWLDEYAPSSDSAQFVTMKNISVVTNYMHSDSLTYNGEVRNIIIGEFGVSGDPDNNDSQSLQAAAYALSYYSAAQNDDIDAFIWHRQVDHEGEGLYYGLWTALGGNVQFPLEKKTVHTVFSQIDTEKSEEVTSFVKTLVGSGGFGLFMPDNVKYDKFNVRTVITSERSNESDFEKGFGEYVLFDLTAGSLCNFYPTDNFRYVELDSENGSNTTMLYGLSADIPTEYAGIGTVITDPEAFRDAQYMTLELMVEAPECVAGMNVKVRMQNNGDADTNAAVFEGEVLLKPNEMQTVSFNIKDLVSITDGDIDNFKLWIQTPDPNSPDGNYGIWLKSVTLHTKKSVSVLGVIFKVLLTLVILAVAAYAVLYIRAERIRRQKRARREQLRREQLRNEQIQRMQYMQNNPNPPQQHSSQNINPRDNYYR